VALGNSRLLSCEGGQATFRYKDHRQQSRHKTMTLEAVSEWKCPQCGCTAWLRPAEVDADPSWPIWQEQRGEDSS